MKIDKDVIDTTVVRKKLIALGCGLIVLSIIISLKKGNLWLWPEPIAVILFLYAAFSPLKLLFIIHALDKIHAYLGRTIFWVVFYFFITPFGWLLRLARPGIMPLKISHKIPSYWKSPDLKKISPDDFDKQF